MSWRVAFEYPNGDKVIASSSLGKRLLRHWQHEYERVMLHNSENEKNNLLMEAFNGMTLFDNYKGITKQ